MPNLAKVDDRVRQKVREVRMHEKRRCEPPILAVDVDGFAARG